jgi:RNA polymerase sigma-70 factor (sigma-E family)
MRSEGQESFEQWARARQPSLLRAAFWMTGDLPRAEDLVQDAFIAVAERWDTLHSGHPDAWVRTYVYRANISWWRRRRRELLVASVPDTAAPMDLYDDALALRAALAQLPPKQRAVVLLRHLEDLSVEQTAAILGVTAGTVKKQSSIGLAKLRLLAPELERPVEDRA